MIFIRYIYLSKKIEEASSEYSNVVLINVNGKEFSQFSMF